MNINENVKKWADEIWGKLDNKLSHSAQTAGDLIPYTTENGKYCAHKSGNISWWTNGFWPGIMWLMYDATGEECFRKTAENAEKSLDRALKNFKSLDFVENVLS